MKVDITDSNALLTMTGMRMIRREDPTLLNIPTYDGSGQSTHPSVVRIPKKFGGYEYWMALTPYPQGNDDLENPSIYASNDGLKWEVPNGVTNPIVPPPADVATGGYNSDPHLLYDGSKLIMFYRYLSASNVTTIYQITSINGVTWTAPTALVFATDGTTTPTIVAPISPTIIRISAANWELYYPNGTSFYRATSLDGINFTHPKQTLHNMSPSCQLWHAEVNYDEIGYQCLLVVYATNKSNTECRLYYGTSFDGLQWVFDKAPLVSPTSGSYYSQQLYRSSMVQIDNGYRIYLAGTSLQNEWRIGYMDVVRTNYENKKFDVIQHLLLAKQGEAVIVAPAATKRFFNINFPGKKVGIEVRLTGAKLCQVDLEMQLDERGATTIFTRNIFASASRTWDEAIIEVTGNYGIFTITNKDATDLTIHTIKVTVFPD